MKEMLAWIASCHPAAAAGSWTPIERGGSDRQFWRGGGAAAGLVAVVYGDEKAENARYADCANFLRDQGISVPQVVAHESDQRFLLLEDAGDQDLWTHREAPWESRRALYLEALGQIARFHAVPLQVAEAAGLVQGPFDESLYTWEQEYFREHFLGREFGPEQRDVLTEQARRLAARPRVLLHRDLQSQNIMVRGGAVTLIDFQGMRAGLAGYDVASLLYDPYVPMADEARDELSAEYACLAGRTDADGWNEELRACARQRLMQALGAYGFLGRVKGRAHFLTHIPVAAARMADLCQHDPVWRPLANAVREAAQK